jgi:hypothetical protein
MSRVPPTPILSILLRSAVVSLHKDIFTQAIANMKEKVDPEKIVDSASDEEKHRAAAEHVPSRRSSLADHAYTLDELPDPDEGKSEEEKAKIDRALLWKVDKWLIPWLALLYLLSFLDRTNVNDHFTACQFATTDTPQDRQCQARRP